MKVRSARNKIERKRNLSQARCNLDKLLLCLCDKINIYFRSRACSRCVCGVYVSRNMLNNNKKCHISRFKYSHPHAPSTSSWLCWEMIFLLYIYISAAAVEPIIGLFAVITTADCYILVKSKLLHVIRPSHHPQ